MIDSSRIMMVFFALFVTTGCSVGAVALADDNGYPGVEHALWYFVGVLFCFTGFAVLMLRKKKKQV